MMKRFMLLLLVFMGISVHAADDSRFVLMPLEQVGGKPLSGYGPNNDWSSIPQGQQTFGSVPFDIVSKLQLHGNTDAAAHRSYPARVIGIPVQQRLARLHLFHGANISETNGEPLAALRLHYAGGKTHTLFIS